MLASRTTFLVDAMLGSLARKLRIFGYDTLYTAHIDDDEILKIGIEHDRVIITCDRDLFKRVIKAGVRGVLLDGFNHIEDLVHVLSKNCVASVNFESIASRCSACNGLLAKKKPSEISARVPRGIAKRHKLFLECKECTKVYWEGRHLKRIRVLANKVDDRLREENKNISKQKKSQSSNPNNNYGTQITL